MNQVLKRTLGPEVFAPVWDIWLRMRLSEDQRKSVVFLGYRDETPGKGGIECVGTAFLLEYQGLGYLVTAKHVADEFKSDPFLIRVNRKDGTSENLHVDMVPWVKHPDPVIDVAIVPFHIDNTSPYDLLYLGHKGLLLSQHQIELEGIGIGNHTYTVGLFRLLSGEKRNMPIVHFGTIAAVPSDEKIPVQDWNKKGNTLFVEGYLVETHSLAGLSGSPVFVRPEYDIDLGGLFGDSPVQRPTDKRALQVGRGQIRLLGLWQGAWDAPPDEILAVETGEDVRVPVGMGVVVPCERIVELLESPAVKTEREKLIAERNLSAAAKPQSDSHSDA